MLKRCIINVIFSLQTNCYINVCNIIFIICIIWSNPACLNIIILTDVIHKNLKQRRVKHKKEDEL